MTRMKGGHKQRFEANLRQQDLDILKWLVEQEGGTRNSVLTRALDLYCAHVEKLARKVPGLYP